MYRKGYYEAWQLALYSWNNTATPIGFSMVGSGGKVQVYADYWGDRGWNAITDNYDSSGNKWMGTCVSSNVKLNRTFMDNYINQKKQSIIAHELGHTLGLDHNTSDSQKYLKPLMWYQGSDIYYDAWGTYMPTIDEINGINDLY